MTKWSQVDHREHFSRNIIIMSKNILGIDVAKLKLDVVLLSENKSLSKEFDNLPKGFKLLQRWLQSLQIIQVHACLEATGIYGAAANFLHHQGRTHEMDENRLKF